MSSNTKVWKGTLALMILKTLEKTDSLHGYRIARQIDGTRTDHWSVNYVALFPAIRKLKEEGFIKSEWGVSENNRKAKFYQPPGAGRKQLEKETHDWEPMAAIVARFLNPEKGLA